MSSHAEAARLPRDVRTMHTPRPLLGIVALGLFDEA